MSRPKPSFEQFSHSPEPENPVPPPFEELPDIIKKRQEQEQAQAEAEEEKKKQEEEKAKELTQFIIQNLPQAQKKSTLLLATDALLGKTTAMKMIRGTLEHTLEETGHEPKLAEYILQDLRTRTEKALLKRAREEKITPKDFKKIAAAARRHNPIAKKILSTFYRARSERETQENIAKMQAEIARPDFSQFDQETIADRTINVSEMREQFRLIDLAESGDLPEINIAEARAQFLKGEGDQSFVKRLLQAHANSEAEKQRVVQRAEMGDYNNELFTTIEMYSQLGIDYAQKIASDPKYRKAYKKNK